MVERHYTIDEDDSINPHHEHVQATTTLRSEVVVEEIVNELRLKNPFEERYAQFEFDLDMVWEQAKALLDFTPEIRPETGETTEMSFPNTSFLTFEEEEKDEHLESVEHLGVRKWVLKFIPLSQSLLRHFMSPSFNSSMPQRAILCQNSQKFTHICAQI